MNTLNLEKLITDSCVSFNIGGDHYAAVELVKGAMYVSLWYCENGLFSVDNTLLGKRSTNIQSFRQITSMLINSLVKGIQSDIIKIAEITKFVNENLSSSCYAYQHVLSSLLSDLTQPYDHDSIADLQNEYTDLMCGSGYWEDSM